MTHLTRSLALVGLLAACAPMAGTPPAATGWGDAPALDAAQYELRDVETIDPFSAVMLTEAAASIQNRLGSSEPVEGNYSETLNVYERDSRGAVVLTLDNLPDDSVLAEQHLVEFDLRPDPQVEGRVFATPTGYGVRHKCARGTNPGVWTTDRCV